MTFVLIALAVILTVVNCWEDDKSMCKYDYGSEFGKPTNLGGFSDPVPSSLSGLAYSRKFKDILYYVEDNESETVIYAVNAWTGSGIGKITINAATNTDWRGIASGPCQSDMTASCLYVHDSQQKKVYVVKEEDDPQGDSTQDLIETITYFYDDADESTSTKASTLFVDCSGTIYFFNRADNGLGVRLYKLVQTEGTIATPIQTLNMPSIGLGPHDASLSYDCCELLVMVDGTGYWFPWHDGKVVADKMMLLPSKHFSPGASISWSLVQDGYFTTFGTSSDVPHLFSQRGHNIPDSLFQLGEVVGNIAWDEIEFSLNQISDLATSIEHQGIMYAISEEDYDDRIYVIQEHTPAILVSTIRTMTTDESVKNDIWETLSVGPCKGLVANCENCIYVLNSKSSEEHIYVYCEPEYPLVGYEIDDSDVIKLDYPAGLDVQTIMVGCDGTIYLFSNEAMFEDVNVYRLVPITASSYTKEIIAVLANPSLAGGPLSAALSPCCDEILVKFADVIYYFPVEDGDIANAFLHEPERLPYIPEINGESITWTTDCRCYLTSPYSVEIPTASLKKYCRLPCCPKHTRYL